MDVRGGLWKRQSAKELMLLNCGVEKTLENLFNCKEIQPVHSKGDQPWVFFGRNDAKAETPVLWPPHTKSWLIGKDSDAGRDWGQEEKGMIGDEMAGWHHQLDGRECEWAPGDGDGQGVLARCSSWACKESDKTEWLNWTEVNCRQEMFFFILLEELIKETVFELNEIRVWWKFIWGFIWSKPQNEYNKHIQMQFLISVPLLNLIIRKMCLHYII